MASSIRGGTHVTPIFTLLVTLALGGDGLELDSDGDGLSDFSELTKYLTDPANADSDGDGLKDFVPGERREYTYTVEAVMRVLPPVDEASLTDAYQDGRILKRTKEYVEIEVVVYPRNGVAGAIGQRRDWRTPDPRLAKWLAPGPTTNFDSKMQRDLLDSLATDGIDLGALTDAAAAPRIARWLLERAQFEDSFTTFAVEWKNGKPRVANELADSVAAALRKSSRTLDDQWNRELFGKGMYETRMHGTCTSTAIYLQTGLRAAGIPTRTIVCVPVIDASDPSEHALIDKLQDESVRQTLRASVARLGNSWASHTFNEVHVGGRWQRLNYAKLAQNVLDVDAMGLMIHVNTFDDHARAGLVEWGKRAARKEKDDAFGHSNPYSCLELSDRVGEHADPRRLQALEAIFTTLTVNRVERYSDAEAAGRVKMRLDDPDTAGHFVIHVEETIPGQASEQYKKFYDLCGKDFVFRAAGRLEIPARATRGYWVDPATDLRSFYLRVEPADFEQMAKDVDYVLEYRAGDEPCGWAVSPGTTARR
jgi:Transglutaminase-like superfamily